jgi:hypothetical protein
MLISWSRPSDERLVAMLAQLAEASVSYDEVGATRQSSLPHGYRHVR